MVESTSKYAEAKPPNEDHLDAFGKTVQAFTKESLDTVVSAVGGMFPQDKKVSPATLQSPVIFSLCVSAREDQERAQCDCMGLWASVGVGTGCEGGRGGLRERGFAGRYPRRRDASEGILSSIA